MHLTSTVKLAVAKVYGYGLSAKATTSPVCDALKREGIYLAPDPLAPAIIERLKTACDKIYGARPDVVSLESNGSDARIFGIDRLSDDPVFAELQAQFLPDAQLFYGSTNIEQFCMAGDIKYHPDSLGSGSGWHRDSPYRHQFKVIIYLTDATNEQGPFEFIPNSHATASVVKSARFLKKPQAEDRFTNAEIETLVENGVIDAPRTMVAPAGSMIYADTRGLHRGRPLVTGGRRAVTFYIYHRTIPANFNKVLVAPNGQ